MKIFRCPSCRKAVVVEEQCFEPSKLLACVTCGYTDYGYAFMADYQQAYFPSGQFNIRSLLKNMELSVYNGELDHFSGRNIDKFIRHQAQKYGLSHHVVFELLNTVLSCRTAPLPPHEEVAEALSHIYCVELVSLSRASIDDLLARIEQITHQFYQPSQLSDPEKAFRLELNSLKRQLEKNEKDYDALHSRHKQLIEEYMKLKEKLSEYE